MNPGLPHISVNDKNGRSQLRKGNCHIDRCGGLSLHGVGAGDDQALRRSFREREKEKHDALMKELTSKGGFNTYWRSAHKDILWCNNWLPNLSALNVEDLTWAEVNARKAMRISLKFLKENVPGFENSFLISLHLPFQQGQL
jgi:beta-N-acetylglucosaminidase